MPELDIYMIKKILAHRYPFLLIDKVLKLDAESSILALKNVTVNEPFFTGHFPERPVMPGVLMIEALAQAAGIWTYHHLNLENEEDRDLFFLTGVDKAKFKRTVVPGDQLLLDVKLMRGRSGKYFRCYGEARVGDELACSAEITAMRMIETK